MEKVSLGALMIKQATCGKADERSPRLPLGATNSQPRSLFCLSREPGCPCSPFGQQVQGRSALVPVFHHPRRVEGGQEASGTACTHGPKGLQRNTCKIRVGPNDSRPAGPLCPALSDCQAHAKHWGGIER